ncbi:hypothetical protein Tco_0805315, partial [Tanacetum coccineum]
KCHGEPYSQQQPLPADFVDSSPILAPIEDPPEATWESLDAFRKDFPTFNLEDKVLLDAEGDDADLFNKEPKSSTQTQRQSTRMTQRPIKLKDSV